jgi:hypothetical protein
MIEVFKGKVIKKSNSYLITEGLIDDINIELRLKIGSKEIGQYIYVLKYVIDYIVKNRPIIAARQTIVFNSWILQFFDNKSHFFDIYEQSKNLENFVEGAEYSLEILDAQIHICGLYSSEFTLSAFNQLVVISAGVFEGYIVEGVRYKSPKHMSGWWLTTQLYDGNVETLKHIHVYDIAIKRPELLKYLALNYGFRFFATSNDEDVWYDESIAYE